MHKFFRNPSKLIGYGCLTASVATGFSQGRENSADQKAGTSKAAVPVGRLPMKIALYESKTSPYCSSVRSFLDYYGFPYDAHEVNPSKLKELDFARVKSFPLALIVNTNLELNGSSFIISFLRSCALNPGQSMNALLDYYPELNDKRTNNYFLMMPELEKNTLQNREIIKMKREEREWRKWADVELVDIVLVNIYATYGEAYDAFKSFSKAGKWREVFSLWNYILMFKLVVFDNPTTFSRIRKRKQLKVDVRENLYDAANKWLHAIGPSRRFLGGDQPCLADLVVYGIISSVEGQRTFTDLMQSTKIGPWYNSVKEAVLSQKGANSTKRLGSS